MYIGNIAVNPSRRLIKHERAMAPSTGRFKNSTASPLRVNHVSLCSSALTSLYHSHEDVLMKTFIGYDAETCLRLYSPAAYSRVRGVSP